MTDRKLRIPHFQIQRESCESKRIKQVSGESTTTASGFAPHGLFCSETASERNTYFSKVEVLEMHILTTETYLSAFD